MISFEASSSIQNDKYFSKSESIIEHCLKLPIPNSLEQFQFQIDEWLYQEKANKPLVIREEEGCDLQCTLIHWMKQHSNTKKDLIVPYFVEHENSNYYYAIYSLLIKLKTVLNVNQKVELEGSKLKQYFEYWLNLCNREIQNEQFNDARIYNRIILVLQGIDRFRDEAGEVRVSLWLPKLFPENVKVIVSARAKSKAFEYYQSIKCSILNLQLFILISDEECSDLITDIRSDKELWEGFRKLPQNLQHQAKLMRAFYIILSNQEFQQINAKVLSQALFINSIENFYTICIKSFIATHTDPKYQDILLALSNIYKGVSIDELIQITQCSLTQFMLILDYFKQCFMEYNGIYSIYSVSFKNAIAAIIPMTQNITNQILKVFEHTTNSLRRLEELAYHYFKQKRYFKLKEVLINVENFLMLWNPVNKFELCQWWHTLENNGFDLVIEYNKAVENFQQLFHPSNEALFLIMLQICRFLREFSNFEFATPQYRHPKLQGQHSEYQEAGLLQELKFLKMMQSKRKNMIQEYFNENIEIINFDIPSQRELFITNTIESLDKNLISQYLETGNPQILTKLIQSQSQNEHYYYRRWLWVQFPWLCLHTKGNFSSIMQFYAKDSGQEISIQEELKISSKALKFIEKAKKNKSERSFSSSSQQKIRRTLPALKSTTPSPDSRFIIKKKCQEFNLPSVSMGKIKHLNQIIYQNQVLSKRLKELVTFKESMYPEQSSPELQKQIERIQQIKIAIKAEEAQLIDSQNETKRLQIITKLCQSNQDHNEETAADLSKYLQNLSKITTEQIKYTNILQVKLDELKAQENQIKKQKISVPEQRKTVRMDLSTNQLVHKSTTKDDMARQASQLKETTLKHLYFNLPNYLHHPKKGSVTSTPRGRAMSNAQLFLQEQLMHWNLLPNTEVTAQFSADLSKNRELQFQLEGQETHLQQLINQIQEAKTLLKISQKHYKPELKLKNARSIDTIKRQSAYKQTELHQLELVRSHHQMFLINMQAILQKPCDSIKMIASYLL